LTAKRTSYTIYTIYNELLELNPEKSEGGERRADGNISIKQLTGAKSRNRKIKRRRKKSKNAKDKISHI
jgi:hypothetical protein